MEGKNTRIMIRKNLKEMNVPFVDKWNRDFDFSKVTFGLTKTSEGDCITAMNKDGLTFGVKVEELFAAATDNSSYLMPDEAY